MLKNKARRKNRNILSQGQKRLLSESLKQLLGPGLIHTPQQKSEREERANFLRDAVNSKILDAEWLS